MGVRHRSAHGSDLQCVERRPEKLLLNLWGFVEGPGIGVSLKPDDVWRSNKPKAGNGIYNRRCEESYAAKDRIRHHNH
jgi:hypothetical protein